MLIISFHGLLLPFLNGQSYHQWIIISWLGCPFRFLLTISVLWKPSTNPDNNPTLACLPTVITVVGVACCHINLVNYIYKSMIKSTYCSMKSFEQLFLFERSILFCQVPIYLCIDTFCLLFPFNIQSGTVFLLSPVPGDSLVVERMLTSCMKLAGTCKWKDRIKYYSVEVIARWVYSVDIVSALLRMPIYFVLFP